MASLQKPHNQLSKRNIEVSNSLENKITASYLIFGPGILSKQPTLFSYFTDYSPVAKGYTVITSMFVSSK